jgi:hypothetical protein
MGMPLPNKSILNMPENKREFFFQCQYQVGKEVLASTTVKHQSYISVAKMMEALCALAINVKDAVDAKTGGRLALEVVHILKDLIYNVSQDRQGKGESKSYYMDIKSKHKANRSERVDVIFYGIGGKDDGKIEDISRFIHYFKKANFKK